MNIQLFIVRHNIRFSIKRVNSRPDGWGLPANHYRFKVRVGKRSFSGYYSAGLGIHSEPTGKDILESLALDARCGQSSFEDFCCDYGYDEDSRKAEKTWKACQRTYNALIRLLGEPDALFLLNHADE